MRWRPCLLQRESSGVPAIVGYMLFGRTCTALDGAMRASALFRSSLHRCLRCWDTLSPAFDAYACSRAMLVQSSCITHTSGTLPKGSIDKLQTTGKLHGAERRPCTSFVLAEVRDHTPMLNLIISCGGPSNGQPRNEKTCRLEKQASPGDEGRCLHAIG